MKSAKSNHLDAAHRILDYIWSTKDYVFLFNGADGLNFYATTNASYASHVDRKSHYGITMHMNSSFGSYLSISKKASLMALPSTEAEYVALFEANKLIMWLCQFLTELGFPPKGPTKIFEDNMSAIHIVNNGYDHGRTKHMDVRYHFIRRCVRNLHITVISLCTANMVADILTKAVNVQTCHRLTPFILGNPKLSLRGGGVE
jgi:hypothetical protein